MVRQEITFGAFAHSPSSGSISISTEGMRTATGAIHTTGILKEEYSNTSVKNSLLAKQK